MKKFFPRSSLLAVLTSSAVLYLLFAVCSGILFNSKKAHINWLNKWQHTAIPYIQVYEHSGGNKQLTSPKVVQRYYQKLDQIYPDTNLIQGALGSCSFLLGKKNAAQKHYKKAIELNPSLYIAYWDLGMISFRDGKLPTAAKLLSKSLKLMPRFDSMLEERRGQLTQAGRKDMLLLLDLLRLRKEQDKFEAIRALAKLYVLTQQGTPVQPEQDPLKVHLSYDLLTLRLWASSLR